MTEDEVRDYGEIVDWITEQSWSNGRVGAMGVSYDGDTAKMLMVNKHPAVRAVAPLCPDFDARDQLMSPAGHLEAIEASGTAIFTRVGRFDAATVNGAYKVRASMIVLPVKQ